MTRFVFMFNTFLFLIFITNSFGFKSHEFKKCHDVEFCRENRERAEQQPIESNGFYISPENIKIDPSGLSGLINHPTENEIKFTFTLQILHNPKNTFRFKIDEQNPSSKRFEPPHILQEDNIKYSKVSIVNNEESAIVSSENNRFVITYKPLKVEFFRGDELVIVANDRNLFHFDHFRPKPTNPHLWEQRFRSHTDTRPKGPASVSMDFTFVGASHVYGIPEHATSFALKPTRGPIGYQEPYRLYNLDVFEYNLDSSFGLYGSVPFMIAHTSKGTSSAVFLLNTSEMYIDVSPPVKTKSSAESTQTHWFAESGLLDIFVFLGPSPTDILEEYTTLTGKPTFPSLFSLSYHQCRWNYKDEKDIELLDKNFDKHDIPCDVLWLDIEHTEDKKYFTWDKRHFPNPKRMIENLALKGRKMVTIVDPHIKRDHNYPLHKRATKDHLYVKTVIGNDFEGHCWPGSSSYLDFFNPKARDLYADEYYSYEGATDTLHTWNDMNEPSVFNGPEVTMQKDLLHDNGKLEHREIHNAYGLLHHMASYDGLKKRLGNLRPFILTRSFFSGSQRYAGVWTGDNMANWDHLKVAQPMLLSLSVSGIPHVGSDVGGFFGNPDSELLTRWYQIGAFHPFFRAHSHIETNRREPWLFGEQTTNNIREAVRSRYKLLPYWYTVARYANLTGVPIIRPLFFEFPTDTSVFSMDNQFLVGPSILVKPVTEPSAQTLQVYLPGIDNDNENIVPNEKLIWYDLDDGTQFKQSSHVTVPAPLSHLPVFQRGGSIIPKRERSRRASSLMIYDPLTLVVALDINGNAYGELYLDDGETFNFLEGEYIHRVFTYTNSTHTLSSEVHPTFSSTKYKIASEIVVERIIFRGLPKTPKVVTKTQNKLTESLQFSTDSKGQLIVRRPWLVISENWKISFQY